MLQATGNGAWPVFGNGGDAPGGVDLLSFPFLASLDSPSTCTLNNH